MLMEVLFAAFIASSIAVAVAVALAMAVISSLLRKGIEEKRDRKHISSKVELALDRIILHNGEEYVLDRAQGVYITNRGKELPWQTWWTFLVPCYYKQHWRRNMPEFVDDIRFIATGGLEDGPHNKKRPDINDIPVREIDGRITYGKAMGVNG